MSFKKSDFTDDIDVHLTCSDQDIGNGYIRQSCLTKALREARVISGRDEFTGIPVIYHKLGWWSAASVYFSILDQLGTCYCPKYSRSPIAFFFPKKKISAIELVLFHFTDLNKIEINEVYMLRNAFLHDFSLVNHNKSFKNFNHFSLNQSLKGKIISLPDKPWNGRYSNRTSENITKLNLKLFGDLVEEIYKLILLKKSQNKLKLLLKGKGELTGRYTFIHN